MEPDELVYILDCLISYCAGAAYHDNRDLRQLKLHALGAVAYSTQARLMFDGDEDAPEAIQLDGMVGQAIDAHQWLRVHGTAPNAKTKLAFVLKNARTLREYIAGFARQEEHDGHA